MQIQGLQISSIRDELESLGKEYAMFFYKVKSVNWTLKKNKYPAWVGKYLFLVKFYLLGELCHLEE